MIVAAPPVLVTQPVQPVYVWVPSGHRKNWSKHCHEYNACGVPVYFVRHDWYRDHVMVAANEGHGDHGMSTATARAMARATAVDVPTSRHCV